MDITFGKHCGRSVEWLVLREPSYTCWLITQTAATGRMAAVVAEARGLIHAFDAKPFVAPCNCRGCGSPATRCTVYRGTTRPWFWCEACDPCSTGADAGKLHEIRAYLDAVAYAGLPARREDDLRDLIRDLARAKGLPDRVGEAQARAFFWT